MKTYRYVPESIMTTVGENPLRGQISQIVKSQFIPASARVAGDYCTVPTMGVLVMTTANGKTRVYGFDDGKINSELRMIVTRKEWTADPDSCRDEVIRKQWPIVPSDRTNETLWEGTKHHGNDRR